MVCCTLGSMPAPTRSRFRSVLVLTTLSWLGSGADAGGFGAARIALAQGPAPSVDTAPPPAPPPPAPPAAPPRSDPDALARPGALGPETSGSGPENGPPPAPLPANAAAAAPDP